MQDEKILEFVCEQSKRMGISSPHVVIKRLKRTYGLARPWSWTITLNRDHIRKGHDSVVKDTIIHELAHLREYWITGKCGHGKLFKSICEEYGAQPVRIFTKKIYREVIAASKKEQRLDKKGL